MRRSVIVGEQRGQDEAELRSLDDTLVAGPEASTAPETVTALVVMPLGEQRGGAELQLKQLVEHRRKARLELVVAFLETGPLVAWCRAQGVPAVELEAGRVRDLRKLGATTRALATLARASGAEVVLGWMAMGQVYGGLAAATARLPAAWFQPSVAIGLAQPDTLATLLPAALVVTVSAATDVAQRRAFPRRRTQIVYPGVDTSRFDAERIGDPRAVRRRLGLPEDRPVFGSVGRLNSWKGFHVLLEAADEVLARHPDAVLVLVGGPHELELEYADRLHEQAARLGYDGRVRLVGYQPNPEEWMQAMDVFVHTSRHEPFGIVVIEAMTLGKPVVASAEGGPTEVITPGVDGLLSPYGDARALAAAISRLLGDAGLRAAVSSAARRRAQDFTVAEWAVRFGDAIAGIARSRS
jgi:hypothetical protein